MHASRQYMIVLATSEMVSEIAARSMLLGLLPSSCLLHIIAASPTGHETEEMTRSRWTLKPRESRR